MILLILLALLIGTDKALAFKATIVRLKGSVLVYLPAKDRWEPARKWMNLPLEAEVRTLEDSFADLLFEKKALVRIKENSLVRLGEISTEIRRVYQASSQVPGTLIRLQEGKIYLLVRPDYPAKPLVVETPIGMAGVTGTRFVVHLLNKEEMLVAVWRGHVLVWDPQRRKKISLSEAHYCLLSRLRPARPEPLSPQIRKRYEEVKKLLLPENLLWKLRSPGSRYEGSFTRGFAPEQDLEEREPDFWEIRSSHPMTQDKTRQKPINQSPTQNIPTPNPVSKPSLMEGSPTHLESMPEHSPRMDTHTTPIDQRESPTPRLESMPEGHSPGMDTRMTLPESSEESPSLPLPGMGETGERNSTPDRENRGGHRR